jgi:hypothetical protein
MGGLEGPPSGNGSHMSPIPDEPSIAFCVREHDAPAFEVRVNFGVFAGRQATPAEIDELARRLAQDVMPFTIIAEERHEFGEAIEASLHLVRIEIPTEAVDGNIDELCDRLVIAASAWADTCFATRHAEISEI